MYFLGSGATRSPRLCYLKVCSRSALSFIFILESKSGMFGFEGILAFLKDARFLVTMFPVVGELSWI